MDLYLNLAARLPVFVLILLSAAGTITGDYFAKSWSVSGGTWRFLVSMLGYVFCGLFYIPTLLREPLVITSIIWSILTIFGFLFIGFIIFKESFGLVQGIGVAFGVASLVIFAFAK